MTERDLLLRPSHAKLSVGALKIVFGFVKQPIGEMTENLIAAGRVPRVALSAARRNEDRSQGDASASGKAGQRVFRSGVPVAWRA